MKLRDKIPLRESLIQNVTFQFLFSRHSQSPRRKISKAIATGSVTFSYSFGCYCIFFRLYLLVLS